MSSSQLESLRIAHEDLERLEANLLADLDFQTKYNLEAVFQTNSINAYLEKMLETKNRILTMYQDKENARKEELQAITGAGQPIFGTFYDRLRELKEYHRKYPNLEIADPEANATPDESSIMPPFSGEERWGKHLDLHRFFEEWNNLSTEKIHDYYTFIEKFSEFPLDIYLRVKTPEYATYLKNLYEYLIGFCKKTYSLFNLEEYIQQSTTEFEEKWKAGEFDSLFENYGKKGPKMPKLGKKKKGEEEQKKDKKKDKRDAKKVKVEPMEGATPAPTFHCETCDQYFAKDTVFQSHLKSKKHAEILAKQGQKGEKAQKAKEKFKPLALLEYVIKKMTSKVLIEQVEASKVWVTKKLSRTPKEIEEELLEEEMNAFKQDHESSDSEAEKLEIKTSIENYPVGWDGKPIPYWLYKLHGLGVEYKCEICGNFSYWGRKAYEKHFQEWRHAHGMRCLGIVNSRHFQDITKINDALSLWSKIKKENNFGQWRPEVEEEFEDKDGNVFNKKTFDDLKRQGLL